MKYIRFKNIPTNELSGVYDGDLGKIRDELGVSCYECVEIKNTYKIILPSTSLACINDLQNFLDSFKQQEIPALLITGTAVGIGSTGEPVLKNVKVLGKLIEKEHAEVPPKYKMDRSYPQLILLKNN